MSYKNLGVGVCLVILERSEWDLWLLEAGFQGNCLLSELGEVQS